MMRLTDDYLILSNKKSIVEEIYKELNLVSTQHSFMFNQQKMQTNIF